VFGVEVVVDYVVDLVVPWPGHSLCFVHESIGFTKTALIGLHPMSDLVFSYAPAGLNLED